MSAPKQLAKRQKLERKRRRKRETRLDRQKKRQTGWYQPDSFGPVGIVGGPVGGIMMSEVLQDFVAPLVNSVDGHAAYQRLFSVAQVAWNAALEPVYRREAIIADAIDEAMPGESQWARQECRELIDWLVARKLERFAKYQRPILSFQLDELDDGGYYLSVISGLFC